MELGVRAPIAEMLRRGKGSRFPAPRGAGIEGDAFAYYSANTLAVAPERDHFAGNGLGDE